MDEGSGESKDEIINKMLCVACLCVGRTLHHVHDEKTQRFYLDALNEISLDNNVQKCPQICWECIAMLKNVTMFKEQVKDSYRILQTYTQDNLHECLLTEVIRPPRLRIHHAQSEDIKPEINYMQAVFVKDEVKNDWAVDIDIEDCLHDDNPVSDTQVSEIKSDKQTFKKRKKRSGDKMIKQASKTKNTKKNKKHGKLVKPVKNPKILTIELSHEEMLKEREKDLTKDSYLNSEFKCESCIIGFNYNKSYKTHITNKHSPELGDYSCPICKVVLASVESFTAHYKRHMRRYECTVCRKRTLDLKVMQQHYASHHEMSFKEYKCHICGKISPSLDSHKYHKDSHKARVQCPDCDKTFRHRAGLLNHRLAVHELQNAFPCDSCEKVFRWKTSLKRHLEKHDDKNKLKSGSAYCSPCGVSFSSICTYKRHLKNSLKHVTQDQLRFICDHCDKRFADKTKLRDHIEEKHLHKTYQCHICLKPSKNRVGLDQHIRNVHKRRPNNKMCHHCGKGFPTKVQLESHIRTHTGERPFICEHCPTTFSQQSNLYKHNKQVHLNIKSKRYPGKKPDAPEKADEGSALKPVSLYTRDGFCYVLGQSIDIM